MGASHQVHVGNTTHYDAYLRLYLDTRSAQPTVDSPRRRARTRSYTVHCHGN